MTERSLPPHPCGRRYAPGAPSNPHATFAELEGEATRQVAALRAELIRIALTAGEPDAAPDCAARGRTMVRDGTRHARSSPATKEHVEVTGL